MRPYGSGGARPRPYGDPRGRGRRPDRDRDRRRPGSTRRTKPKPPLWTKLTIIFGAVVMFASGAVVVVPRVLAAWALGDIPTTDAIPEGLKGNNIDGPIDFLLLGTDSGDAAQGSKEHDGRRTDSIVLLHIPASHDIAYLISFPRDLYVPIAPSTSECGGNNSYDRLNSAYAYGLGNGDPADPTAKGQGAARMAKTISCLVQDSGGLTFEGAAIINFDGMDRILEAVGGVHMCFDDNVWSIHYRADGTPWYFEEATYHGQGLIHKEQRYYYQKDTCRDLQPWEALDYSRQRYGLERGDGDYGRQRHQQQMLRALISKLTSSDSISFDRIAAIKDAAGEALTLDLNDIPLLDWVFTLKDLRADDLVMIKTYGGKFAGQNDAEGNYLGERYTAEFKQLLQHVQNGTVFDFLAVHPDWIASDAKTSAG